ncbi:unnamed protein product [Medioppia subpectinata]|uniref:RING-type E3 ubiquitin transferase n=1 Tax=Medioppia subpectinata TaxID=1979941 RepID=A0A7R9L6N0_9ACAR|nr:unnamed protein product [Medioppia subpectinata]CAG2115414.1 unnamed protein product [Medioppia subpectinata]
MDTNGDNNDDNEESVERIEGIMNTSTEAKSCPICLTQVSNRSLADTCLHEFCFDCLSEWSSTHNRCPVCRQPYRHIIHNIVSEEVFARTPVQHRNEDIDVEVTAVLRQMFLFLRVISARNRSMRLRDQVKENLDQMNARLSRANAGQSHESRRVLAQLEQQIQELRTSLERIDTDITELNAVLNSEDPTEVDLMNGLNGREEDFNDVIGVIDVLIPVANAEALEDNEEWVPEGSEEEDDEEEDAESLDSTVEDPDYVPDEDIESSIGSESGDESDRESSDDNNTRRDTRRKRRQSDESDNSEDEDYLPANEKRRKK